MTTAATAAPMPKKKPARTPTGDERERKPLAAQIRGTEDWKGWLEEFANHDHGSVANLIERALVSYAKQTGFERPMPKR